MRTQPYSFYAPPEAYLFTTCMCSLFSAFYKDFLNKKITRSERHY